MLFDNLTDEQKAKLAGKTPQEIFELAKEEGHELSEDDLDAIAGGWRFEDADPVPVAEPICPVCGYKTNVVPYRVNGVLHYHCEVCSGDWKA